MFPNLQIGPLSLPTSPLLMITAVWIGILLAEKYLDLNSQGTLSPARFNNLIFLLLVVAIVGARLGYATRYPQFYSDNLFAILSPRPEALDLSSAILFSTFTLLIYQHRNKLSLWLILDSFSPLVAFVAIILPISQLADGSTYGTVTGLPWGVFLWGALRHPVQLYEAVVTLMILLVTIPWKISRAPGTYFLKLTALLSLVQIAFQPFHGDGIPLYSNVRLYQFFAWLILAITLYLLFRKSGHHEPTTVNQ